MRQWSIGRRLSLVTLMVLALLGLLLFFCLQIYQQGLMGEKSRQTQAQVETAYSLVAGLEARVRKGELDEASAKAEALALIKGLRYGNDDYFWINDSHPTMVMHPMKPELDGKDLSGVEDKQGLRLFVAFADLARAQGAGEVAYYWPKPGVDEPVRKISYIKRFAPWDWIIGTGVYVDDVEAQYREVLHTLLGIGLVLALLLFAVVGLIVRSIVVPLSRSVSALGNIARGEGDLRVRLPESGRDELSQLSINFNLFASQMAQLVARSQQIADQNRVHAHQLAEVVERTGAIVTGQEQDTLRVASAMEQMTVSSREVGQHAAQAADAADSALNLAQHGREVVVQTRESISQLADEMVETVQAVSRLEQETQQIGSVLDVIRGVAEQTNLLALNAAIEAARAGEAGRGFAVVADEVRNLSRLSSETAQKMTDKVDTINTAIGRAFQIAENAAARDHASALNSEQTIEQVLARFRHATDSLAESASLLQNESTDIHREISSVIVSLQFQDRVSQILSHVRQNMESLSSHLVASEQSSNATGPIQIDANRWLAEMELSYATDEQRNIHHGRTTRSINAQPSSADITFF